MDKKKRFFETISEVQTGKKPAQEVPIEVRKLAKTLSAESVSRFSNSEAQLKEKKALLATLKELRSPSSSILQEDGDGGINPIAKTFTVKDSYDQYVRKHIGQPILPKELEAIDNFQAVKPTQIGRTEVKYETSDSFGNNTTTIIKKMKDSGQFSYNAFQKSLNIGQQKQDNESPEEAPEPQSDGPGAPAPEAEPTQAPGTNEKDDIVITKSPLFTDEIKGGALLVDFLKKLDL